MISTKGRYALRVMADLAEHETDGYIPLKDVAQRQLISKKYLEIIVRELVKNGLLKGCSGKGGGYKLCKKSEEYTVMEILEATEGDLSAVACLSPGAEKCPNAAGCKTLPLWREYDKLIRDFFTGKNLSDLF